MQFSEGQYVELLVTVPSTFGGSVPAGTRGVVREIDELRIDDDIYRVALLGNEQPTGEQCWLRAIELIPG